MKTIKKILFIVAVLVSTVLSAQTQTENYVKTTVYQTEVQEGKQTQVIERNKIETVNYFDGLGRAKQSIAVRAAGQEQNTNLLDWTGDWTLGSGNTPFFNMNGPSSDNERLMGVNPFGEQSLLWRCGNDAHRDRDGGWYTDTFTIDNTVHYRYTVWVKRTGSHDGTTYHGPGYVNNLDGTPNSNPYFWSGDLPKLNTWYLIVGIVHPHTYTGADTGISGVYDTNGNKVKDGTDFKWRPNYNRTSFRSFFFYSTDVNTLQYFWNPVAVKLEDNKQPIKEVIAESKPKDIVTHYEYDVYGRQAKEYLPYASKQTKVGAIYTNPLAELEAFYDTPKYENTPNPYSEKIYEASPLNRVVEQGAPGKHWKAYKDIYVDHTIRSEWATNKADEVPYFKVDFPLTNGKPNITKPILVKDGFYAANELNVTIIKDENWLPYQTHRDDHTTREYTDKLGRVILKKTYDRNVAHDTYYVYDDFGNLTYVIPPKVNTDDDIDREKLNELCYQYVYDGRNRLVEKKIPGKGRESIVYNTLDQPIMTQDANQKPNNEWLFTKYDAFGRVAYTGLVKYNAPFTLHWSILQKSNEGRAIQFENRLLSLTSVTSIAGTDVYYSDKAYPNGGSIIKEIHTINYYDNYTFDRNGLEVPAAVFDVPTSTSVTGLPTGSKVQVLGTNSWITKVIGYDGKGRPIWTGSRNDYLKTTDIIETQLDFAGKVLNTKTTHTKDGNAPIVTIDTFTYDHMGRLLTQQQQIDNQAAEMIVANTYDELGQLESKKVGNAQQAPLQTVDYQYNVRGWLTHINDVDNIGNDLFTFKINYNTSDATTYPFQGAAKLLYNGNISETHWKTANDAGTTKHSYRYHYDALNRITKADFSLPFYQLSNVTYDKNGNITKLVRTNDPSTSDNARMDNLEYSYGVGNQLEFVTDIYDKNVGFIDGNTSGNDYEYDVNGNMTIDRNKGIQNIKYNHLNLPTEIKVNHVNFINYIYDALGNKLEKKVSQGTITHYAGNYIYKTIGGAGTFLEFINTPEGYAEPKNQSDLSQGFDYIYQYKDHLGNIRLSYADANGDGQVSKSEIREEKNYYPFGLQHKGYNNTITGVEINLKTYQGQELDKELNLNWHHFKFRTYDATIGRFLQIDPLSATYVHNSTYAFAENNVTSGIDLEGLELSFELDGNRATGLSGPVKGAYTLNEVRSIMSQRQTEKQALENKIAALPASSSKRANIDYPTSHINRAKYAYPQSGLMIADGVGIGAKEAVADVALGGALYALGRIGKSVWNLNRFARGRRIENMLGANKNWARNFPVIDKIEDGAAVSIKSIDLDAKSYKKGNNLFNKIRRDIDKLDNFGGRTEWAGDVVEEVVDYTSKTLEIAVQTGKGTDNQWDQISKAVNYAMDRDINISIRFID